MYKKCVSVVFVLLLLFGFSFGLRPASAATAMTWAGSLNGSLLYALTYLVLWIAVAAILYKSRIFIKV